MIPRKPLDAFAAATMAVLCTVWGSQQVALKLAAPDMSPLLQIALRSAVAAAVVGAVVLAVRAGATAARLWRPGLAIGALFGLEFVFVGEGLRFTSAAHMAIFLYTAPIFAALGLHLSRADERLSPVQWAGIGLAFGGVVLSFAGRGGPTGSEVAWIGDLLGLAAGAAWGATTVVVRGSRFSDAPAPVTLLWELVGAAVLTGAAALALGQTEVRVSGVLAASLAYQSVVVAVASFLAWLALLRVYLASRLGILSFMTPVLGVTFGVIVLGERIDAAFVAGGALILAGILVVSGADLVRVRRDRAARVALAAASPVPCRATP